MRRSLSDTRVVLLILTGFVGSMFVGGADAPGANFFVSIAVAVGVWALVSLIIVVWPSGADDQRSMAKKVRVHRSRIGDDDVVLQK